MNHLSLKNQKRAALSRQAARGGVLLRTLHATTNQRRQSSSSNLTVIGIGSPAAGTEEETISAPKRTTNITRKSDQCVYIYFRELTNITLPQYL
jgi:hypothetical protein